VLWAASERTRGIRNTVLASFFLGWAPILGKMAYANGVEPFTLASVRTLVAAVLLWAGYLAAGRPWLRITWRGLLGCIAVGVVNGVGSLLYYSGLSRLDASLASFLNTLYLLWVVLFLTASGQPVHWLTLVRMGLAMGGIYLLTGLGQEGGDWLGAMLMVASAAVYGWYMVLGQWVLADINSRTATPSRLGLVNSTVRWVRLSCPARCASRKAFSSAVTSTLLKRRTASMEKMMPMMPKPVQLPFSHRKFLRLLLTTSVIRSL